MSIYTEIRQALESHLNTTTNLPAIAWENVHYEPDTGTPFISARFQPTSRRPAVRGLNPQHRVQGIFTLLCHYPENQGPGASQTLVDRLIERFDSTTDISYTNSDLETINVCLDYTEQQPSYNTPPWYVTPIIVAWYTYN